MVVRHGKFVKAVVLAALFLVFILGAFAFRSGYLVSGVQIENIDEMHNESNVEGWFQDLSINRSLGEGAYLLLGTVHSHIRKCTIPDSESFGCLEAQWKSVFRRGIGSKTELCEAIESPTHKALCISGTSEEYYTLTKFITPYLQLVFDHEILTELGVSEEESKIAAQTLKSTRTMIKACTDQSVDCLSAQWRLAFHNYIPEDKMIYCEMVPSEIHKQLCYEGLQSELSELEKPFK